MFQSSARKPLLRTNSDRPTMRNWPLFAFLFGLVFFFYIFYIYQSQSTEMAILREQLDNQLRANKELKNQFISVKADNEILKSSETSLKTSNGECTTKYDECAKSLRDSKVKTEAVQFEKTKMDDSVKTKDEELSKLKDDLAVYERNNTALKSLLSTQESLSLQLNETVAALKEEISTLKDNKQNKADAAALKDVAVQTQPEAPKVEEKKTDVGAAPLAPVADGQKETPLSGAVDSASGTGTQTAENTEAAAATTTEKSANVPEPVKDAVAQMEVPKVDVNGENPQPAEEKAQSQQEKPKVQGGDYVDEKDDKTNQLVDNNNSEAEEGGL